MGAEDWQGCPGWSQQCAIVDAVGGKSLLQVGKALLARGALCMLGQGAGEEQAWMRLQCGTSLGMG